MPLYDRRCFTCLRTERDIFADRAASLREKCPTFKCDGFLEWKPSIGSVDAREPFFDDASGKHYTSYREMEKDAAKNGRTVMPYKEWESRQHRNGRVEDNDRNREKRREAIKKSYYRIQHGYADHPRLEKESGVR